MGKIGEMWKNAKKTERVLVLLALGLLLVVFSWPERETPEAETVIEENKEISSETYESELESRLEAILSELEGVGEVSVMITLESTGEKFLQVDTETDRKSVEESDSSGGMRSQEENSRKTDTLLAGGSSGEPYVIRETMPQVEGVLVLADGAGKASVRSNILEAVQALFSLDAHKIKVFKRD